MSENLRRGSRWRAAVAAGALLFAMACEPAEAPGHQARPSAKAAAESAVVELRNVSTVVLRGRNPVENSAAAMSRRQPGVLFTINDSGNEAELFAVDTTGAFRGSWRVTGVRNVDWEATSIGPCGASESAPSCVYIGDTGDNDGSHASRVIYRVAEPTADGKSGKVKPEALRYSYTDQPHDVEAMYVAPNGDIILITKRALSGGGRRLRPALVFRVSASAWGSERAVAQLVDSLPIVPGSVPFRLITDAALMPSGRFLAVRTYAEVYVFATDSVTGAVNHRIAPRVCAIGELGERQGEGMTWANENGRLVLTSEGRRAPLRLGDCPLPRR